MKTTLLSSRRKRIPSPPRNQSGQALVEFAIAFPFLLLLVLAIIQLALIYNARQVVAYAAFSAARSTAVYPNQREKALNAAVLACTPISSRLSSLASSVLPALGDLPEAQQFSEISGVGGLATKIVDKYYYSQFFTTVSFFDSMGEKIRSGELKVGDEFTVEVTHRYNLIIPLANRIIAFRHFGIPGTETSVSIPEDTGSFLGQGLYFYPIHAHVTMRVEDDT